MCCVQRDLVGGSVSNADDGEDTEEEIGSDEEFDSDDGDLGEKFFFGFVFPFFFVYLCCYMYVFR